MPVRLESGHVIQLIHDLNETFWNFLVISITIFPREWKKKSTATIKQEKIFNSNYKRHTEKTVWYYQQHFFQKNLKSFCGKKNAFDCAGIRAQVFRLQQFCWYLCKNSLILKIILFKNSWLLLISEIKLSIILKYKTLLIENKWIIYCFLRSRSAFKEQQIFNQIVLWSQQNLFLTTKVFCSLN